MSSGAMAALPNRKLAVAVRTLALATTAQPAQGVADGLAVAVAVPPPVGVSGAVVPVAVTRGTAPAALVCGTKSTRAPISSAMLRASSPNRTGTRVSERDRGNMGILLGSLYCLPNGSS